MYTNIKRVAKVFFRINKEELYTKHLNHKDFNLSHNLTNHAIGARFKP